MKRVLSIAAVAPLLAVVAGAQGQDETRIRERVIKAEANLEQAMQMKMQAIGAVKGMTVKGAPYSGEEINETNHSLADGTRIHKRTSALVYRDSEGRTRRETPDSIIINDPTNNTSYILNPKTMTGQKLISMTNYSFVRRDNMGGSAASATGSSTFTMRMESDGGTPTITVNGETLDAKKVQELMARAKADGATMDHMIVTADGGVTSHVFPGGGPPPMAGAVAAGMVGPMILKKTSGEPLGKQTIEGVSADGTRTVNTIKAGTIGNDRDIQVTGENWYSAELQTMIMSKHNDPRTGEESFRLININRNEPAAYLFQVPSGYTIGNDKK